MWLPLTSRFSVEGCRRLYEAVANRAHVASFREADGVAAIEFALVAAPFFAIIIAILDLALLFTAQAALETAVEQTARLVLTGQAVSQGLTASQFQQNVCNFLPGGFTCSNVMIDLQT